MKDDSNTVELASDELDMEWGGIKKLTEVVTKCSLLCLQMKEIFAPFYINYNQVVGKFSSMFMKVSSKIFFYSKAYSIH